MVAIRLEEGPAGSQALRLDLDLLLGLGGDGSCVQAWKAESIRYEGRYDVAQQLYNWVQENPCQSRPVTDQDCAFARQRAALLAQQCAEWAEISSDSAASPCSTSETLHTAAATIIGTSNTDLQGGTLR